MKKKIVYILAAVMGLMVASCESEKPAFTLSQDTFNDISPEGEVLSIDIQTAGDWTATSINDDWCSVYPGSGTGNGTIRIEVEANLSLDRTGSVVVYCNGERTNINITQSALPAGQELTYRIPLIFHVLYRDANDPYQYITPQRIEQVLDKVNQYYDGITIASGGEDSQDINLEFVLAEADESGNLLETPGVEYIEWNEMPINCESFMQSSNERILNLMWDMNKYVNVMLYNFADVSGGTILGISHLPLTVQGANQLEGLQTVAYTSLENENLGYPQCVSINSLYFDEDTPQGYYNPLDANVTLAHELGHYLGLHHAFNENEGNTCVDTDYCEDTPPYNRDYYILSRESFIERDENGDIIGILPGVFDREDCNMGDTFTSYNLMDYEFSYADRFTPDQRVRMRHVLEYSPLIPGAKRTAGTRSVAPQGVLDIPIIYKVCGVGYHQTCVKSK